MNLLEYYTRLLVNLGHDVDSNDYIVADPTVYSNKNTKGKIRHKVKIDGKHLLLPTPKVINNPNNDLIFHPLNETILANSYQSIFLTKALEGAVTYTATMAALYGKLVVDRLASRLDESHKDLLANNDSSLTLTKLKEYLTSAAICKRFVAIKIKKKGTYSEASMLFLILEDLKNNKVGDIKLTDKLSRALSQWLHLCWAGFLKDDETAIKISINNSKRAEYDAFMKLSYTYLKGITDFYNKYSVKDILGDEIDNMDNISPNIDLAIFDISESELDDMSKTIPRQSGSSSIHGEDVEAKTKDIPPWEDEVLAPSTTDIRTSAKPTEIKHPDKAPVTKPKLNNTEAAAKQQQNIEAKRRTESVLERGIRELEKKQGINRPARPPSTDNTPIQHPFQSQMPMNQGQPQQWLTDSYGRTIINPQYQQWVYQTTGVIINELGQVVQMPTGTVPNGFYQANTATNNGFIPPPVFPWERAANNGFPQQPFNNMTNGFTQQPFGNMNNGFPQQPMNNGFGQQPFNNMNNGFNMNGFNQNNRQSNGSPNYFGVRT